MIGVQTGKAVSPGSGMTARSTAENAKNQEGAEIIRRIKNRLKTWSRKTANRASAEIITGIIKTEIKTITGIRRSVGRKHMRAESESLLKVGERLDDLERNGYRIIQSRERFCFGMDAVLLSGFVQMKAGACVLDLGTGTGIIPILLEAKTEGRHFTGLEIQEESADMARRSVRLNGLEDKIDIVNGDIKDASTLFGASSFDVVTTNPPYMVGRHGLTNADEAKTIARHEVLCTLEDVISQAARLLKPGGHFFMVHRPFRLVEIFCLMHQYRMEPKRMRMVHPFVNREPNMVLIEGLRGGNARLSVEKPLIVFKEKGIYTEEITELYGY